MRVIARELRCTAVRISGGDPGRLSTAGELAAAEGLEVWFAPFPCELTTDQLAALFARLRGPRRAPAPGRRERGPGDRLRADPVRGRVPARRTVYERIGPAVRRPQLYAAYAALPGS